MSKIETLSAAQKASLETIQAKWSEIARSTHPIDRAQAADAVRLVYQFLRFKSPRVVFFDSPNAALQSPEFTQLFPKKRRSSILETLLLLTGCVFVIGGFIVGVLLYSLTISLLAVLILLVLNAIPPIGSLLNSKPFGGFLVAGLFSVGALALVHGTPMLFSTLARLVSPLSAWLNGFWLWLFSPFDYFTSRFKTQQLNRALRRPTGGARLKARVDQLWSWLFSRTSCLAPVNPPASDLHDQLFALTPALTLSPGLSEAIEAALRSQHDRDELRYLSLERWCSTVSVLDFCITELNRPYSPKTWAALQKLLQNCGWVFLGQTVCLVCDRPTQLAWDTENRLHADGKPAIAFADGFEIHAYHGTILPQQYTVPTSEWQANWLLTERNAQLRRMLVAVIGYERLCQDLGAYCVDIWRDYELLYIPYDLEEPFQILKMTCPSTHSLHFLVVPPDMNSAREAISWVNWDIDPEDFAIET